MNNRINIISPRSEVEIHLPDGRVLSGPRGAAVGEFLAAIDCPSLCVGAIVNGELRELTYSINMESKVEPVLMESADGARIYRRSLTFLLEKAFTDLHPGATLYVDHSVASGGYYCQVTGRDPLSVSEIDALKSHMLRLIEKDLSFERKEIPLADAIVYFHSRGYEDKVSLLQHRKKDYLTLYSLEGHMDYHHGYMVPSTGYLRIFDIQKTDGGFTLSYPRRHKPDELLPVPEYPKLLAAFRQYGGWLARLGIESVGSLNEAIEQGRADEIVLVSEAFHEQNLSNIARLVADQLDKSRLIFIAGPSSSGKTTFSRRLTIQLLALGISPFPLELDNFFLDRDKTPLGEDGKPDFETTTALNLPLLADRLQRLIRGEEVQLPRYNFKSGKSETGKVIQLKRGQPIILEGIHGMDPRLIRRIVRDARERGYKALHTIRHWESVRRGEKRHIFPYQENANVMFNSALAYEMAALKPFAEPLLRQVPFGTPEYIEAKRLLAFLEWFLPLDVNLVPDNSLLREFLGGSMLKDFTVWKNK